MPRRPLTGLATGLVTRLLAGAAARWPAELRDELTREWAAELHALAHEAGVAGPVRRWRQLRFAASLALARPPDGPTVAGYWLRRASPVSAQATWLLAALVLAALAAALVNVPLLMLPFGWIRFTPASLAFFAAWWQAIQAGVATLVGVSVARRTLRHRSGRPVGAAGCAWAALPMAAGLIVVDLLARTAGRQPGGGWLAVIAALWLAVLVPPVAAAVAALAGRGRLAAALALAAVAAPVLSLAATFGVVRLAPARPQSRWWWLSQLYREPTVPLQYAADDRTPIESMLPVLAGLVLTTVVVSLAYAVRAARPLRGVPAPRPVPSARPGWPERADPPAQAASPWWHRTALAGAGYAVVAWAVTLTYLTPNIGVQNSWSSRVAGADSGGPLPAEPAGWPEWTTEEGRVWMHELQLFGIVCATLCLMLAGAYRGRPVRPAVAAAALLLAGNVVIVRGDWLTVRLLPWLAAGGLLLGAVAWWATVRRGAGPARQSRRLVIALTLLAAFLLPSTFLHRFAMPEGVSAPPALLLVAVGLPAVLAGFVGMGVRATTARPVRGPAWRLPAGLGLLVAAGGWLCYQPGWQRLVPEENSLGSLLVFALPTALALPVTAWAAAAVSGRHRRTRRPRRLLLASLLLMAGYPLTIATAQLGFLLATAVLSPMEYGRAYDGVPYLPGAVAVGVLIGWFGAGLLDRPSAESVPVLSNPRYVRPGPA